MILTVGYRLMCVAAAAVEMNNNKVTIDKKQEHGKCMPIQVLLWIQQQLIFAIFVAIARKKSGLSVIMNLDVWLPLFD